MFLVFKNTIIDLYLLGAHMIGNLILRRNKVYFQLAQKHSLLEFRKIAMSFLYKDTTIWNAIEGISKIKLDKSYKSRVKRVEQKVNVKKLQHNIFKPPRVEPTRAPSFQSNESSGVCMVHGIKEIFCIRFSKCGTFPIYCEPPLCKVFNSSPAGLARYFCFALGNFQCSSYKYSLLQAADLFRAAEVDWSSASYRKWPQAAS